MNKVEMLELLDKVPDDTRIAMVMPGGRVVDISETLVCNPAPNWLDHTEVHLFQQRSTL